MLTVHKKNINALLRSVKTLSGLISLKFMELCGDFELDPVKIIVCKECGVHIQLGRT